MWKYAGSGHQQQFVLDRWQGWSCCLWGAVFPETRGEVETERQAVLVAEPLVQEQGEEGCGM